MAHNSPDIPEPTIKTSVLSLVDIYYKVAYQPYTRNMIIKEDDEIIAECLSGNTDSYKYLVEKYQFRIINTCYKYTKNIVDAEDVAQEVFLKAYQNLSTFKSDSKFYSWLYRIAVNTSLNYINSKEKRNEKETISEENCLIDMNISKDNPRDYYQLNELINTATTTNG
jgi:RNA polymerase sigma-70 factor (ECF subfamily)